MKWHDVVMHGLLCPVCQLGPPSAVSFPICVLCFRTLRAAPPLSAADINADSVSTIQALYSYSGPARRVLAHWKYRGGLWLDHQILGRAPLVRESFERAWVIPMPQYYEKAWLRNGAAADKAARVFARAAGAPIVPVLQLAQKEHAQREQPLQGRLEQTLRFTVDSRWLARIAQERPTDLVIVDDFLATGRTVRTAVIALQSALQSASPLQAPPSRETLTPRFHVRLVGFRPRKALDLAY